MLTNVPIDGLLLFLFLTSPVLALIAAFIIRWRYRISVSRLMMAEGGTGRTAGGSPDRTVPVEKTHAAAAMPLTIEVETLGGTVVPARPLIILGVSYFVAGLAHGIVSTIILFVLSDIEFLPVRTTIVCMVFSTPAVFSALFAMGVRFHLIIVAAAAWLAVAIAIASPFGGGFAVVWQLSWFIALPLLTTLLVINRTVGTVAPFLLVPAMLLLIGLLSTLDVALFALENYESVFAAYAAMSLPVIAGILAGLVYLAIIAWQYSRGRASELTLQADMLWLLVSTFHAMPLIRYEGWLALTMFIPFIAYRLTLWLAGLVFRSRLEPARLLFLRVFGFRKRQAELHRLFLNAWRGRGPVTFIGSADLALETMDPPELFAFITGRLRRIFVSDPTAMKTGLTEFGQTVDGLYPIDDFYCFDDTWQPTVQALIDASAAILMDLRGFGPDNMGCVFEIEELLKRADPGQLIFLVDATTDKPFLERCMQDAWARSAAVREAPSGVSGATVRVWAVSDARALKRLIREFSFVSQSPSVA